MRVHPCKQQNPPAAVSKTRGGRERTLRAPANQCRKPPPDLTPNAAKRSQTERSLSRRADTCTPVTNKSDSACRLDHNNALRGPNRDPVRCPVWCRCTPLRAAEGVCYGRGGRINDLVREIWGVLILVVWDSAAGVGRGVSTVEERRGLGMERLKETRRDVLMLWFW